ncbi:hypothetical protein A0J61_04544 [Choanephora cucurbitarum]|uniref:Uncharacterized protein n=1 Tax=Choanephora cucurbitarum TaxID=101091 RepID=A0A1C7NEN4_9FUNG|nr:hypothetical protein A0J61_04544 [Choanephora cucurbitarum]
MISRIFSACRNTSIQRPVQQQSRHSLEDSSEEFVRATQTTKAIQIPSLSTSTATLAYFGLSYNNADDFIQKDLISNSLY